MSARKQRFHFDPILAITAAAILAMGLLMVASASMVISDRQYGYPFHYFFRQLMFMGVGLLAALIVINIPLKLWQVCSGYLLMISFVLLVLVLIPGIGKEVNGSARWLGIGAFSIQVSEFAKISMVMYLSSYLVRREEEVQTRVRGFIKPLILLAIIAILFLQEPDFGATVVLATTVLAMLFLAGVRLWQFIILILLAGGALAALAVAAPYRVMRLTTFLHPWANQFDTGYQLTQSLIAFGRGGFWGVGLGNSIQKLFYLPEAHTDFLFAVLAEELGLIGQFVIIALFVVLIGRALWLAYKAYLNEQRFEAYLAWGLSLGIGLQVLINIGVNSGMLPTKGLTLPLMSYGGSSLLISCIVIALLLRVAYETSNTTKPVVRTVGRRR